MKRSNLFLTGMTAALLFGLTITGCDSGSSGSDGPTDQTATISVETGHTALAVIPTGGALRAGYKVFISIDGSEVTITNAEGITGAIRVSETKVSESESGTLLVKGLAAAAPDSTTGSKLKSGTESVRVILRADAQSRGASGLSAKTGIPFVLPDGGQYEFVGAGLAGEDKLDFTSSPAILKYQNGSSLRTATLDAEFDEAVITALTALRATLPTNSEGTFAVASGAITKITTAADAVVPAGTTLFIPGANIDLAQGNLLVNGTLKVGTGDDAVTFTKALIHSDAGSADFGIGAIGQITLKDDDTVTVLHGGSITVGGTGEAAINTGAAAIIDATLGSLIAGDGENSVTIANAVLTATAGGDSTVHSSGVVTLAATDTLALGIGGSVTAAGTGKVDVGGAFEIRGAGTWTAGANTVTFDATGGPDAADIAGGDSATLSASGDAEIAVLSAVTLTGATAFTVDISAGGKISVANGGVLGPADVIEVIKLSGTTGIANNTDDGNFAAGTGTDGNASLAAGVITGIKGIVITKTTTAGNFN